MNFTFKLEDHVLHKNMGTVELVIKRVFDQAKHVVVLESPDGTRWRAYVVDLVRIFRPSDESGRQSAQEKRNYKAIIKEKEEKMRDMRRKMFEDHVTAGGRLRADGRPDRRIKRLRKAADGRKIIWIGRK